MTHSSGTILAGGGRFDEEAAVTAARKRVSKRRLILSRRPETGVGEWLAAMVRGLDALEFLERSRPSLPD